MKEYPHIPEHLKPTPKAVPEFIGIDPISPNEPDVDPPRTPSADDVSYISVQDFIAARDTAALDGVNLWVSRTPIQRKTWGEKERVLQGLLTNDVNAILDVGELHNFPILDEDGQPFPARSLLIVYVVISRGGKAYCKHEAELRSVLEKILVLEVEGSLWEVIMPELRKNNTDMETDAQAAYNEAQDIWNLPRFKIDKMAIDNIIRLYNEAQRLYVDRANAIIEEATNYIPDMGMHAQNFLNWLGAQRKQGEELLRKGKH
jgi:hypothetical protein